MMPVALLFPPEIPPWLTSIGVDSCPDLFRLINMVLAVACAMGGMFDRYAPWRDSGSTLKLLTFTISGTFLWNAYTFAEVVWLNPAFVNQEADMGIRAYGFTVWYLLVAWALIERHHRLAGWAARAQDTDPAPHAPPTVATE